MTTFLASVSIQIAGRRPFSIGGRLWHVSLSFFLPTRRKTWPPSLIVSVSFRSSLSKFRLDRCWAFFSFSCVSNDLCKPIIPFMFEVKVYVVYGWWEWSGERTSRFGEDQVEWCYWSWSLTLGVVCLHPGWSVKIQVFWRGARCCVREEGRGWSGWISVLGNSVDGGMLLWQSCGHSRFGKHKGITWT